MANKPTVPTFSPNATFKASKADELSDDLATAIQGCLGRGGTSESPNSMTGVLDMDLNKIQNLGPPIADHDALRLVDLSDSDATGAASGKLRSDLASILEGYGIDLIGNSVKEYTNIAALKAITAVPETTIAIVKGYYASGDNGGGNFYWDSTSTETDNGGTILKATAITTGRWRRLYSGAINVKWFGAKGDGTTTDTTAIQAALNTGDAIYFHPGTYVSGTLTRSGGISITGAGIGISVLKFNSTDGITITSSDDAVPTQIEHMSFLQSGAGLGTALIIDNTGQISGGTVTDRTSPRLKIENIAIRGTLGADTNGWLNGIYCKNVMHVIIDGLHFDGYFSVTQDNIITDDAIKFDGTGGVVEIVIVNSWAFYADNVIKADDCEGVFVDNCNFVAVNTGIRFEPPAIRPQLQVTNSHINANVYCIVAGNLAQANISDNLLYARPLAVADIVGISLSGSTWSHIKRNIFVNNNATYDFNTIVLPTGGEGVVIQDNIFQSAATAIWLQASSSKVIVGYNTYGSVSTKVLDQGTLNIVVSSVLDVVGTTTGINGLIQKWGSTVVTLNASGDGTITFAVAFPNNFFTAVVTNGEPGISGDASFTVKQDTSNAAGMAVSVRPNPGAGNVRFNWTAFGK